jgi:uncharacterized protein
MPTPDHHLLTSLSASPDTLPLAAAVYRARELHREWEARIAKAKEDFDALRREYQQTLAQQSQILEVKAEMLVVTNELEAARKECERLDREVNKRKAELNKLEKE